MPKPRTPYRPSTAQRTGPTAWLVGGLLLLSTWAASAQAEVDGLVRMATTGRIHLGVRDGTMPLSYLDGQGAHIGYHVDVCLRVVEAIRQRFDMPALKVVMVPTTLATRFSLLNNHTVDIECGHNPVNPNALRQALVSHATLLAEVKLMTRADTGLKAVAELDGRSVGVVVGSTAVPALRAAARLAQVRVREVPGRVTTEVFSLLEQGRVDAVAFSAPYMLALKAKANDAQRFQLMPPTLRTDPVALMFHLEDEKLHALANEVLAAMMRTGEMGRLYAKWFEQPIQGLATPLNLPITPALQQLFANPGSELFNL